MIESSLMSQASWPLLSSVLAVCLSRKYLSVQCMNFSVLILKKLCLHLDIFIVVFSSLMEILSEPQSRGDLLYCWFLKSLCIYF